MSAPSMQLSMPVTWEPIFASITKFYQFHFWGLFVRCPFITVYTFNHLKPAPCICRRESCKSFPAGLSLSIVTFFPSIHLAGPMLLKMLFHCCSFAPPPTKGSQYNAINGEKKIFFLFEMRMAIIFQVIDVWDNTLVLSQTDAGFLGTSLIPLLQFPCLKY